MGHMIKTSALRVYSPEAHGSQEPVPGFVRAYGMVGWGDLDADRVIEWDGRALVCPSNLRLRVLESTVAFANLVRGSGVWLVPEEAAKAAARELRRYHGANPGHRSHILTSAWHVPVRWFTGFLPEEQEAYERPDGQPGLRYRAPIGDVRSRVARALEVLRGLANFQTPADELEQLANWLEPFDPGSVVELDYDEVASLFEPTALVVDDSCELVHESIAALEAGDMVRAGECYGKVVARWSHSFSLSFSS